MELEISDASDRVLDAVLTLNEAEVPHVGAVDIEKMRWFSEHAHYFRVARCGDRLAGFLVGLLPDSPYPSPNYRWFCQRYANFGYIDRVAVADEFRRRGIASRLYNDFTDWLPVEVRMLACEVNLDPPNPASMRFHERLGFEIVGEQALDGGRKTVAMLGKSV